MRNYIVELGHTLESEIISASNPAKILKLIREKLPSIEKSVAARVAQDGDKDLARPLAVSLTVDSVLCWLLKKCQEDLSEKGDNIIRNESYKLVDMLAGRFAWQASLCAIAERIESCSEQIKSSKFLARFQSLLAGQREILTGSFSFAALANSITSYAEIFKYCLGLLDKELSGALLSGAVQKHLQSFC